MHKIVTRALIAAAALATVASAVDATRPAWTVESYSNTTTRRIYRLTETRADGFYPAGLTCADLTGALAEWSPFLPFHVTDADLPECGTDDECEAQEAARVVEYCDEQPLAPYGSNKDLFCGCYDRPAYRVTK